MVRYCLSRIKKTKKSKTRPWTHKRSSRPRVGAEEEESETNSRGHTGWHSPGNLIRSRRRLVNISVRLMWCFPWPLPPHPPRGTWRSALLFTSFLDVWLIPGRERSGSESQPNPPPQLAAGSTGGVLTTNEWKAPWLQFYSLELDFRIRCERDIRCACAERLAAKYGYAWTNRMACS